MSRFGRWSCCSYSFSVLIMLCGHFIWKDWRIHDKLLLLLLLQMLLSFWWWQIWRTNCIRVGVVRVLKDTDCCRDHCGVFFSSGLFLFTSYVYLVYLLFISKSIVLKIAFGLELPMFWYIEILFMLLGSRIIRVVFLINAWDRDTATGLCSIGELRRRWKRIILTHSRNDLAIRKISRLFLRFEIYKLLRFLLFFFDWLELSGDFIKIFVHPATAAHYSSHNFYIFHIICHVFLNIRSWSSYIDDLLWFALPLRSQFLSVLDLLG